MNAPILASTWSDARFTVAQVWALIERGVIRPDAKFELLDGRIIPMSPKGPLHEKVRETLMQWLIGAVHPQFRFLAETTLYLEEELFVEPDYVVYQPSADIENLKPSDILLVIEVADSSWTYDTEVKAPRYAQYGIQEYWAVNAKTGAVRVHRSPGDSAWGETSDVPPNQAIAPLCAPTAHLILKR